MRKFVAGVLFFGVVFVSGTAVAGPHYDEGLNLFQSEAYTKASKRLSKAFKKEPESRSDAALLLSYCYERMGKGRRAIDILKRGRKMDPGNWQILYRLGGLCQESGDYFTALAAYEAASEIKPDDIETMYRLGVAYDNTAQIEKALKVYRKLRKANSPHAEELLNAIQGIE